jgi:hypothetical protein
MATKLQITTYAKKHGISRQEAKEHFINEAKNRPAPFYVSTTVFDKGLPVIDKTDLMPKQIKFVEGCEKTWVETRKERPNAEFNFAYVCWINKNDFSGGMLEAKDPDTAEIEMRSVFDNHQQETIMSGYPQLGQIWTLDMIGKMGGDMARQMANMLSEGGTWPWPNAKAIFTRKGDNFVVTQTL